MYSRGNWEFFSRHQNSICVWLQYIFAVYEYHAYWDLLSFLSSSNLTFNPFPLPAVCRVFYPSSRWCWRSWRGQRRFMQSKSWRRTWSCRMTTWTAPWLRSASWPSPADTPTSPSCTAASRHGLGSQTARAYTDLMAHLRFLCLTSLFLSLSLALRRTVCFL